MSDDDLPEAPRQLYLELLKACLTRSAFGEKYEPLHRPVQIERNRMWWRMYPLLRSLLAWRRLELVRRIEVDPERLALGQTWPADAETMIGRKRLDNLHACVVDVLERRIPGDLLEAGVWRGGAGILMRGILKAYGDAERSVWLADSFEGLPKPDAERYPADAGDRHWEFNEYLAVSEEQVRANFERYGLLDDRVRFLPGWFHDTLPKAPVDPLAILRLDGDMYASTIEALDALYSKLSVGGYLIIDDYGAVPNCKAAVEDFRRKHGITEEIRAIDASGVYWQRVR